MAGRDEAAWRVGVLFSRSGVSGVTETEHFLGTALAIEEINHAGGVLGRPIAPVCYDPAGDNAAYRVLARRMLGEDGVEVLFGCSLSASRKSVLSTVERHNGLLWYPSIYEGFEYSENIIYTGATLNQNVFALADYLLQEHGPRIFLIGSDYIYPRESNRVMRDLIEAKGGDDRGRALRVPRRGRGGPRGDDRRDPARGAGRGLLHRGRGAAPSGSTGPMPSPASTAPRCPIASLTLAEGQIRVIGPEFCTGHILAAPYFAALAGEENRRFVAAFQVRFGPERPTSMWSQTAYAQVHLFARALAEAGTLDAERLGAAALRQRLAAPEGELAFDGETRHLWLTPGIGVARADGQFDVVWRARRPVRPDPYLAWSRFETNWLEEGVAA